MKIDKKIFETITKLENFTETGHLDDLVDKKDIKESLLKEIPFAIFFNECVEHEFTYRECLDFIQLMVHHSCPEEELVKKKEKMIPVWNRMQKMLAGKYEFNPLEENLIVVHTIDTSNPEQFYVSLDRSPKPAQKNDNLALQQKESNCTDLEYEVGCYFIETGVVECSAIQKHFGLGFNSAQKIIYELEKKNVVSERQDHGKRSVLVDQKALDIIYMQLNKKKQQLLQQQEQQIYDMIPDDNMKILLKYDLLNDVVKAIRLKNTIVLDKNDFANVLNHGPIFGYSKVVIPFGEMPKITELCQPSGDVKIIFSMDTGLTEYRVVNEILNYFRSQYPKADIVFGTSINDQLDGKMELFALMTCKE